MSRFRAIGFVPARAGSQRVKGKNTRPLAGHPLMAYAIASAVESRVFDRVMVSTDSPLTRDIAVHYGADVPFLRPAEFATSTSLDIEWIRHTLAALPERYDVFAILRPTSPFRSAATIRRGMDQFLATPGIDSLRAVELCRQHPGKMWTIEGPVMKPLLDQSGLPVAWHAMQYPQLPKVYIQNSSLEIAWTRVVTEHNTREGKVLAPFLTGEAEGFSIDYEQDWMLAQEMLRSGTATLPVISRTPFVLPPG